MSVLYIHNCGHTYVLIYISSYVCNYAVRLVGGSLPNEGRLEVYYNGEWGTVCSNGWDNSDSSLVCRQLGFGSSTISREFGPGTGRILLDNVICSGTDTVLGNCGHYGVGITVNCDHSKDVAIKCYGMTTFNIIGLIKESILKMIQLHHLQFYQLQVQ